MADYRLTEKRVCGHCSTRAPMQIVADYREKLHELDDDQTTVYEHGEWFQLLKCLSCEQVELRVHKYHNGLNDDEMPTVYRTLYPEVIAIPDGLPKKVKDEYERALKARHGDSNGYGVLLGRVLESVFHDKKAKGRMIGEQLGDLAARKLLPPETIAFADKLNKLRVVGAHFTKGKLTPKDIPIMEKLTTVILEYVYSAPYIMKQAEKAVKKIDNKKIKTPHGNIVSALMKMPIPIRRQIVKDVPLANFLEISVEMPNWKRKFLQMVNNDEFIKYEVYNMPVLSIDIKQALFKKGYRDLILESDHDQHFLMPKNK